MGLDPVSLIVMTGVSVGVRYASAALQKKPKETPFDNHKPTLSNRGTMIPLVFGRHRIAPVIAWVGNRRVDKEEVDAGSGFPPGGETPSSVKYRERACHVLPLGPIKSFERIVQSGRVIYDTPIVRGIATSGSSYTTKGGNSSFKFYFGEHSQPVDTFLGKKSRLNIYSRWPHLPHLDWDYKILGPTPVWKQLEYDVLYDVPGSPLTASDSWMDESAPGEFDDGCNAAHILWQLLTGSYPYGVGMPVSRLDSDAFESLGEKLEQEHIPTNLYIEGGSSLKEHVTTLMDELSFLMPQKARLIRPFLIRKPCDNPPVISADMREGTLPEKSRSHIYKFNKYLFKVESDAKRNFRTTPVTKENDAAARQLGSSRPQIITFKTISSVTIGNQVSMQYAPRLRAQDNQFSLAASRAARYLTPGDPFILEGFGLMRLVKKTPATDTPSVKLDCYLDQYSQDPSVYTPSDDPEVDSELSGASPDVIVRVAQIPSDQVEPAGETQIVVWRVRANSKIIGADIWISLDGSSYFKVGEQNVEAAGGTLNSFILIDDPDPLSPEPSITPYNDDVENVTLLDADQWNAGVRLVWVDDEVGYLQGLQAEEGGYQLKGFQRAKEGTSAGAHSDNVPVLTIKRSNLTRIRSPLFAPLTHIYVKTQPRTNTEIVSLADVTAVEIDLA